MGNVSQRKRPASTSRRRTCLAEETAGLYITAENRQDLVKAFEKTLGCPMMSAASPLQ
jgi:hypothetical protein